MDRLPEPLLLKILSLLPCKDAVRTSVLSRRWQLLWTHAHMPILQIVDYSNTRSVELMNFMKRVLALREEPLSEFQLKVWLLKPDDMVLFYSWVDGTARHKPQRVILYLHPRSTHPPLSRLPKSVFRNIALRELDVNTFSRYRRSCSLFSVPSNLSLPNLTILSFKGVEFIDNDGSIEKLSSLPTLEAITLSRCDLFNLNMVQISALNLKRLSIKENEIQVHIRGCKRLSSFEYDGVPGISLCATAVHTSATVRIIKDTKLSDEINVEKTLHCMDVLLKHVTNVKHLHLCRGALEVLNNETWLLHRLPLLHNILHLRLSNYDVNLSFEALLTFLRKMPRLEVLCFDANVLSGSNNVPIPCCISSHLKKLEIRGFSASKEALSIIQKLLGTAIVLEKMILVLGPEEIDGYKEEVIREINEFSCVSRNCKIDVSISMF